jgi:hypothetical protein
MRLTAAMAYFPGTHPAFRVDLRQNNIYWAGGPNTNPLTINSTLPIDISPSPPAETAEMHTRTSPKDYRPMELPKLTGHRDLPNPDGQQNETSTEQHPVARTSIENISTHRGHPVEDMQPLAAAHDMGSEITVASIPFESIAERRKTMSRRSSRKPSESASDILSMASSVSAAPIIGPSRKRKSSAPAEDKPAKKKPATYRNQHTPKDLLSQDPQNVWQRERRPSRAGRGQSKASQPVQNEATPQPVPHVLPSPDTPTEVFSTPARKTAPRTLSQTPKAIKERDRRALRRREREAQSASRPPLVPKPSQPDFSFQAGQHGEGLALAGQFVDYTEPALHATETPPAVPSLAENAADQAYDHVNVTVKHDTENDKGINWAEGAKVGASGCSQTVEAIYKRLDRFNTDRGHGREKTELYQMAKNMGSAGARSMPSGTLAPAAESPKESASNPENAMPSSGSVYEEDTSSMVAVHASGSPSLAPSENNLSDDDFRPHRATKRQNSAMSKAEKEEAVRARRMSDIMTYSKPGEDLNWLDMPGTPEGKRRQNLISTRKHIAKKKAEADAEKAGGEENGSEPDRRSQAPRHIMLTPRATRRGRPRKTDSTIAAPPSPQSQPEHDDVLVTGPELPQLSREEALGLSDVDFMRNVKDWLRVTSQGKAGDYAQKQAQRILDLLKVAEPANRANAVEAMFLPPDLASAFLQKNQYFGGPIFTEGAQPLELQTISQFFDEHYGDSLEVFVQDPAKKVSMTEPHVRRVTMKDVKMRFAKGLTTKPWNCLELATHVEDGLRPKFLNNEDCRLLTKIKFPSSGEKAGRKGYEPGWKEVEKWALVAQAGALTEPHQDSHGYSTYITVNQGILGYGWLSNPTEEERAGWNAGLNNYIGGRWRYVLLRPGHTVYFPAGTVHFVFRLPAAGDTLAFGGHVLRCSQIVRWIECILQEQREPNVTNEDLSESAPGYLGRVENFVLQALREGKDGNEKSTERWGGKKEIEKFLKLKREFDAIAEEKISGFKGKRRATPK